MKKGKKRKTVFAFAFAFVCFIKAKQLHSSTSL